MQHTPEPPGDDVAVVLEQLRAEVRARRQQRDQEDAASASQTALERQLQHCLEELAITRAVSAHWPLESRSPLQRVGNFINKVVRRFLRWYINPIVEQQNNFNATVTRTLNLLVEGYSDILRQHADAARVSPADGNTSPSEAAPVTTPPAAPDTLPPDTPTQQLQAIAEERGSAEPPARFPEIDLRFAPQQLANVQAVHAHWPLHEHTLPQRAAALVQKASRFYLRWLINPIVEQQNSFNAAATRSIEPLLKLDTEARVEIAARRARQ
jgi:hypothetical protein